MNDGGHFYHNSTATPPLTAGNFPMRSRHKMMMHMNFFWGTKAEVLFTGWPGSSVGMYVLSLVFVFVLSVLVEWLSHCRIIKADTKHVAAGMVQTVMYGVRVGLAYMVMLAVMSFNVGVFLAALVGHAVGFLVFGSRVFQKEKKDSVSDLPPMTCSC